MALLAGMSLMACSTSGRDMAALPEGLTGTTWRAETIAGQPVAEGVISTITFAEGGKVHGLAGCNRYAGTLSTEGDRVRMGPLVATRMACPPPLMDQEQRFVDALERGLGFRREGAFLLLESAGDATPSRFSRSLEEGGSAG
jgi:putative lipoprotein